MPSDTLKQNNHGNFYWRSNYYHNLIVMFVSIFGNSNKDMDKGSKENGQILKNTNAGPSGKSRHGSILHWGGNLFIYVDGTKVVLFNTCSVDNLLYMTYLILSISRSCLEWFQANATRIPVCQCVKYYWMCKVVFKEDNGNKVADAG